MGKLVTILMLCTGLAVPVAAQPQGTASDVDRAAIRAAALDYIDGWYSGDAARMERGVHPELAKRMVYPDPDNGASTLNQQGALTLVQSTGRRRNSPTPDNERRSEVVILDVYENAASVRVDAFGWVDYLHLVRWNGQWKIINVLWELRPGSR